jgi:hypothetical protein
MHQLKELEQFKYGAENEVNVLNVALSVHGDLHDAHDQILVVYH